MSKYINYEPLFMDGIDYKKCKYLINEVCCNGDCDIVGDYPDCKSCNNKDDCKYFEKEDGEI